MSTARRTEAAATRACGSCSLCCVVLRVDELRKLGGTPCVHQRDGGGCSIHPRRPDICRAYRCAWLAGSFEESDRPDRLGALLDFANRGGVLTLEIREARPRAFEDSPRLQAIAASQRHALPVRLVRAGDVLDPDRPVHVWLPDGTEQRVEGDRVHDVRDGEVVGSRRMPWLERTARRLRNAWLARRLRGYRR